MNEGLVRLKVLDTKRAQQEALLARGRSLNDNSYQQAFDQIRAIVKATPSSPLPPASHSGSTGDGTRFHAYPQYRKTGVCLEEQGQETDCSS